MKKVLNTFRNRCIFAGIVAVLAVSISILSFKSRESSATAQWADVVLSESEFAIDFRAFRPRFDIPPIYSFAKYEDGSCVMTKGPFFYPTRLVEQSSFTREGHHVEDGFSHFIYKYPNSVEVVISRPVVANYLYVVELLFVFLAVLGVLSLFALPKRKKEPHNYFRRRFSLILILSLFMTLAMLSAFSIIFVYQRNEESRRAMMTERLSTVQSFVQNSIRGAIDTEDLRGPFMMMHLREISSTVHVPITVYSPDGREICSTQHRPGPPEMGVREMAPRIDEGAYDALIVKGKGFYFDKQRSGPMRFHMMYAPIFGLGGNVIGIIGTPFHTVGGDFESDAIMHALSLITFFIVLLIISYLITTALVSKIFKPLSVMSGKMDQAEIRNLQHIDYEADDELRPLVDSYNRMVDELSRSSVQLAKAERDNAWSEMARQVAHEIKNPLTPMKLQLQRIVRMRRSGNPKWEELFDEASVTLLEHIDILTETANEFSTFAKLYTEEPSTFDLDKVLESQVSMYDSQKGVRFEYAGLPGTMIQGPKPQLIRVFVNLLNNAVQACTGGSGEVRVTLRDAGETYEIVFEDNGPGVSEDNQGRLFTPKFTTKNDGSGLGLAMCRSILDKSGASIAYSASAALGGACFTISYPKN